MTSLNQPDYIIPELHKYATLKFVDDINSDRRAREQWSNSSGVKRMTTLSEIVRENKSENARESENEREREGERKIFNFSTLRSCWFEQGFHRGIFTTSVLEESLNWLISKIDMAFNGLFYIIFLLCLQLELWI